LKSWFVPWTNGWNPSTGRKRPRAQGKCEQSAKRDASEISTQGFEKISLSGGAGLYRSGFVRPMEGNSSINFHRTL
jgi:hypothetical protein